MKRKSSTLLLLSLLIGSIPVALARPPLYRIVEVHFPVPDDFQPTTINRKLQIAVSMDSEQQNHLWLGSNGQYRELAIPANEGTVEVRALNDRSEILGLGFHDPNIGFDHGFIWRGGQFEDLTPPAGTTAIELVDINNRDQVIGYLTDSDSHTRPVLWEQGHFSDLPVLAGGVPGNWWNGTAVYQINDAGIAVGHGSVSETLQPLPVVWLSGAIRQLPLPENGHNGVAYAINNLDHIVGVANLFFVDPSVPQEPLFWHDGGVTILPIPEGDTVPVTNAINDRDEIVGSAATPSGLSQVLLWEHGAVYDVLSLVSDSDPLKQGLELLTAERILNSGAIEVFGHNGSTYGFYLLIPTT
jgi:uncharacterized membrane protein